MITSDDILLMKAVLLYIVKNTSEEKRDVYSIVKTAYYEQQIHMKDWYCPTYNGPITALEFGPVPSIMYNILKYARGEKEVLRYCHDYADDVASAARAFGFNKGNNHYFIKEDPDMDFLSPSDVESLDKAIAKVAKMTLSDIIHDTHGKEWERAYYNSPDRKMNYLSIAREGGADEDIIDYMAENLAVDRRYS